MNMELKAPQVPAKVTETLKRELKTNSLLRVTLTALANRLTRTSIDLYRFRMELLDQGHSFQAEQFNGVWELFQRLKLGKIISKRHPTDHPRFHCDLNLKVVAQLALDIYEPEVRPAVKNGRPGVYVSELQMDPRRGEFGGERFVVEGWENFTLPVRKGFVVKLGLPQARTNEDIDRLIEQLEALKV